MSSFKDNFLSPTLPASDMPSLIERAFQIARSGECRNKSLIIMALRRKGYHRPDVMLHGITIGKQLREATREGQQRIAKGDLP